MSTGKTSSEEMRHLNSGTTTFVVVVGNHGLLFPGIMASRANAAGKECFVSIEPTSDKVRFPGTDTDVSINGCTLFRVYFPADQIDEENYLSLVPRLFEEALHGVNELIYWMKMREKVKVASTFARRLGPLDVRLLVVPEAPKWIHVYKNPLQHDMWTHRNVVASVFKSMLASPNPVTDPVPSLTRRVLGIYDLYNLGFYGESFVASFALLDDLTQRVVDAGLAQRGIENPKKLRMAIKEDRLRFMLEDLLLLGGWQKFSSLRPDLLSELQKVNTLRNQIMHGDKELTWHQCLESLITVFAICQELAKNPFDFKIAIEGGPFERAKLEFARVPWSSESASSADSATASSHSNSRHPTASNAPPQEGDRGSGEPTSQR